MTAIHYDEVLTRLITRAAERLDHTLESETPAVASALLPWLQTLTTSGRLVDYFTHPRRFPMLLLPWWAAEVAGSRGAEDFHGDVVYSTMCAYCQVRLMDDVVDRRGEPGLELIPATAVLHTECLYPYLRHFPAEAPFWPYYRSRWLAATNAAIEVPGRNLTIAELGERAVDRIGPATIPLAAVLWHAGRAELIDPWCRFTLGLARVEQLLDDLTDWHHDAERGQSNVLLAEGARHVTPDEPAEAWVIREGLLWALDSAAGSLTPLRAEAAALGSEAVGGFLDHRADLIAKTRRELEPGVRQLDRLTRAWKGGLA